MEPQLSINEMMPYYFMSCQANGCNRMISNVIDFENPDGKQYRVGLCMYHTKVAEEIHNKTMETEKEKEK